MTSENTVRVSIRLKSDVHSVVLEAAEEQGLDAATFMQSVIEAAVMNRLSDDRQKQLEAANQLYPYAQKIAKRLFSEGKFDAHFTLTTIRELMGDAEGRGLYLRAINAEDPRDDVPGKTPVNMYLGWYIKNAIPAQPLLDASGKARRAFVKGEAIKSYTLLRLA